MATSIKPLPFYSNPQFERLSVDYSVGLVSGSNDELFLLDGTNQSARFATGVFALMPWSLANIADNLTARLSYCGSRGIRYAQLALPNKESSYPDSFLPGEDFVRLGRKAEELFPPLSYVDIPADVDGQRSFYRYDTHPCLYGNAFIASQILKLADIDASPDHLVELFGPIETRRSAGDLGKRLTPIRFEPDLRTSNLFRHQAYTNHVVNIGHIRTFSNPEAPHGTAVCFGDSYSWNVVPYLSHYFKTVAFLHSPNFHPEFVEEFSDVELVINANVERFLSRATRDEDRVDARSISDYLGKTSNVPNSIEIHYRRDPSNEIHAAAYSKTLMKTEGLDAAVRAFADIETRDPEGFLWRARLNHATGKLSDAISDLTAASQMAPWITSYHHHLSKYLLAAGDERAAAEHAVKAFCLRPASDDTKALVRQYKDAAISLGLDPQLIPDEERSDLPVAEVRPIVHSPPASASPSPKRRAGGSWFYVNAFRRYANIKACGLPLEGYGDGFYNALKEKLGGKRYPKAVSLGCGTARYDFKILQQGLVDELHVIEFSEDRIAAAQVAAARLGLSSKIRFSLCTSEVPEAETFDLLISYACLHTLNSLQDVVRWSYEGLNQGGLFAIYDFVGPAGGARSEASLQACVSLRERLRPELLQALAVPYSGQVISKHVAKDNSIISAISEAYAEPEIRGLGGSVYDYVLKGAVPDIDPDRDADILRDILAMDDDLNSQGDFHYVQILAEKSGERTH